VEARDRSDHLERIAMREDDAGVGVRLEQCLQAKEVRWRLQDPTLARAPPLEVLQEAAVRGVAIRRS
jgi:G:T-mismatch repair DNA endonuclease (very short patch repair protein)